MIYLVIFFLLFFVALTQRKSKFSYQGNTSAGAGFYLCVFGLILFSGLRGRGIGIDTSGGYYNDYLAIKAGIDIDYVESAWVLLNKVSIGMGWGYPGVLSLASLMTLLPTAYVLRKKCNNPNFGIFIYYGLYIVVYSFNIMRQCVAIAWVFLTIYFFEKKKYISTVISLGIAMSFHKTAALFLLAAIFSKIRLKYTTVIVSLSASFLFGIVVNKSVMSLLIGSYATYLDNTDGYAGFRNNILVPVIFTVIVNLFFLILLLFGANRTRSDIWYKTTILGIMVMNMSIRMGQGTRVVLYFSQAQAIFMPAYVQSLRVKNNRILVMWIYFAFLFANFLRILIAQSSSLLPYRFFWMEE